MNNPYLDSTASIVIGLILASVAVFLAYETKRLLVGEGADAETLESIRALRIVDHKDSVPSRVVSAGGWRGGGVERMEQTIRSQHPDIEAESIKPVVAKLQPQGGEREARTEHRNDLG